jgi:nickel transport protein
MLKIFLTVVSVLIVGMPAETLSHGTDYRIIGKKGVVIEFFYSDKKPMQYAEVLVLSPENDTIEYQNGRTDQNGRFAFLPEMHGKWRVQVNDGVGHAVSAAVAVNPEGEGSSTENLAGYVPQKQSGMLDSVPKIVKLILGISLMANFFLGLSVWKSRIG